MATPMASKASTSAASTPSPTTHSTAVTLATTGGDGQRAGGRVGRWLPRHKSGERRGGGEKK